MYTLRCASSRVHYYEINANDFVIHVKSIGREGEFRRWAKHRDQALLDKLSVSIHNKFQGMNIDGLADTVHVTETKNNRLNSGLEQTKKSQVEIKSNLRKLSTCENPSRNSKKLVEDQRTFDYSGNNRKNINIVSNESAENSF